MSKLKIGLLVLVVMSALLTSQPFHTVRAANPAPPIDNWCCDWTVVPSRAFVWMRLQPGSANVMATVKPGQPINAVNEPLQWDGVQWWGKVKLPLSETYGWVEAAFIQRYGSVYTVNNDPKANFTIGSTVRVRSNVKFVWLRNAASHFGAVLAELPTGTAFVVTRDAQRDSIQWWWSVRHPKTGLIGWVEQSSLEAAPDAVIDPTPLPQTWVSGSIVKVRSDLPFAWLRINPLAWANPLYTVSPGTQLQVLTQPQYVDSDGQWWVAVKIQGTNKSGFVEQNSLILQPSVG